MNKKGASLEEVVKLLLWAFIFALLFFGVYTLLKRLT
jgi:hypothetical protein